QDAVVDEADGLWSTLDSRLTAQQRLRAERESVATEIRSIPGCENFARPVPSTGELALAASDFPLVSLFPGIEALWGIAVVPPQLLSDEATTDSVFRALPLPELHQARTLALTEDLYSQLDGPGAAAGLTATCVTLWDAGFATVAGWLAPARTVRFIPVGHLR